MATDLLRLTVVAPLDAPRAEILPHVENQAAQMATVWGQIRYIGPVDHVIGADENGLPHKFQAPTGSVFHQFECDAVAK